MYVCMYVCIYIYIYIYIYIASGWPHRFCKNLENLCGCCVSGQLGSDFFLQCNLRFLRLPSRPPPAPPDPELRKF